MSSLKRIQKVQNNNYYSLYRNLKISTQTPQQTVVQVQQAKTFTNGKEQLWAQ